MWTTIYSDLFAFIVIKSHALHFHVALKESQNNLDSEEKKHLCTADTKRK